MSLLKLAYYLTPVLHKPALAVTHFDESLKHIIQNMIETMYAENGIGLAAPQVGIAKRLAVIDVSEQRNNPFCIVNPEIIERKGEEMMEAGCLSIPGVVGSVLRATYVKVKAQNENGAYFEVEGEGLLAHCLQHEMDHLEGRLFIDYFSTLKRERSIKKMIKFLRSNRT